MSQYQPYQRFTEADREKIAGRLRDAFADGRLDQTEFSSRLDKLYAVQTYGELEPLVRDLPPMKTYQTPAVVQDRKPAPAPGEFPTKDVQRRRNGGMLALGGGFTGVVGICVLVWFVTGLAHGAKFGNFWPVWMLIPWGIIVLGNLGKRR
jgi:hypothetical protein